MYLSRGANIFPCAAAARVPDLETKALECLGLPVLGQSSTCPYNAHPPHPTSFLQRF